MTRLHVVPQNKTVTMRSGKIKITLEPFNYAGQSRMRPKLIAGEIKKRSSAGRGQAPMPIAFIDKYGTADKIDGHDRGHLIGLSLGGEDCRENIVPMCASLNQGGGRWRALEICLENATKTSAATVKIEIKYLLDDKRIPSGFTVTAKQNRAYVPWADVGLNEMEIANTDILPMQYSEEALAAIWDPEGGATFVNLIKAAIAEDDGYKLEQQSNADYLNVGDCNDGLRPYAGLDKLWISDENKLIKDFLGGTGVSNGRFFASKQKDLIRLANRLCNDGWLKTDYSEDPVQDWLALGNAKKSLNIDHVHPKGKAGCNAFSNARCASRKYNSNLSDNLAKKDSL